MFLYKMMVLKTKRYCFCYSNDYSLLNFLLFLLDEIKLNNTVGNKTRYTF